MAAFRLNNKIKFDFEGEVIQKEFQEDMYAKALMDLVEKTTAIQGEFHQIKETPSNEDKVNFFLSKEVDLIEVGKQFIETILGDTLPKIYTDNVLDYIDICDMCDYIASEIKAYKENKIDSYLKKHDQL